jgi:predicted nucleic-acid-binding protein
MRKDKSHIPKLDVPEFKPSIPEHMVNTLKDVNIKFLIEQVSIIKQQNKWQSEHIAEVYDYTRTINGQVIDLQEYRRSQEVNTKIQQEFEEKNKKYRKFIIPSLIGFGLILYPFYISAFLSHGPSNLIDLVKLF